MGSLVTCIRRAGDALAEEDRIAILERAQELRKQKVPVAQAAAQAVAERLEMVQTQLEELTGERRASEPGKEQQGLDQGAADALPGPRTDAATPGPAALEGAPEQDTNPDEPVPAPDGSIDYGEITPEMGKAMRRQAGKIRLTRGVQNKDGTGYGLAHIEARHGREIRAAGFSSVVEFVSAALKQIDELWQPGATSQLVAVNSAPRGKVVFLQLELDRAGGVDFYRVNSAFPTQADYTARKARNEKWKPLWSKNPVSAQASGASGFAGQPPDAGGAAPTVSPQSGDASVPPPPRPRQASQHKAAVENFGQALPPARRAMAAKLDEDLSLDEIERRPLSEIWPAAENDAIEDTFAAAVAHAARAEIPAKPRKTHRIDAWATKVQMLRELAGKIVSGRVTREKFAQTIADRFPSLAHWLEKVTLLEALPREHWKRVERVAVYGDARERDATGQWVARPSVLVHLDGKPHNLAGTSVADVVPAVRALLGEAEAAKRTMQFEVRGAKGGPYHVNKKGDPHRRPLMTFAVLKEAFAAIKDQYPALVAAWDGVKARDNITERDLRSAENRPRAGKDHRDGKDVTVEQFQERFGFRGGEWGKWVQQGKAGQERQTILNDAYDALSDLADLLGLPPRAMSLNGTLGLAFGSRGAGWASAHFEPNNLVINLTKTRGAGSLGHEWFHALDNYFARLRNEGNEVPFTGDRVAYDRANFVTHRPEPMMVRKDRWRLLPPMTAARLRARHEAHKNDTDNYAPENWERDPNFPAGVRPEMERLFADLVKALNDSPMARRAGLLDANKSGNGYWSRTLEMAARAFEKYLIARMNQQGYHNDFLVNVRKADDTGKDVNRYPYLLPSEVPPVADAFDALFAEMQAVQGEDGRVALLSRGATDEEANSLAALADNDELFALPKSDKDTVEGIAADIDPDIKVVRRNIPGEQRWDLQLPTGKTARLMVRRPNPYGPTLYGFDQADGEMSNVFEGRPGENPEDVPDGTEDVFIDASLLESGGMGANVYQIAATFAHNTGRIFIGDPAGLSDAALVRRNEQMLSSALKFGTTRHLAPHPRQTVGDSKLGVPALKWVYGDDLGNIRRMVELSVKVQDNAGLAEAITFEPSNGQFYDSEGNPITRGDIRLLAEATDIGRASGAGDRTLARVAVLRALLREAGSRSAGSRGRDGLLARLAGLATQYPSTAKGLFYSRGAQGLTEAEAAALQALPQETRNRLLDEHPSIERIREVAQSLAGVDVEVVQSVADLPPDMRRKLSDAKGGMRARGAYFPDLGRVVLIADNLHSEAEAVFVALHEAFHRGLGRMFGDDARKILRQMYHTNGRLQRLAKQQMTTHGIGLDEAIEEALADLAGEGRARDLRGWDKLVQVIRDWLGKVAQALGADIHWSDDMIEDFVAGVRDEGKREGGAHVSVDPVVRESMGIPVREAHTFAQARAAAKDFQGRTLINAATGMKATVSRNTLDKMLSQSAVSKTGDAAIQSLAVANVDRLFENAILGWSKPDDQGGSALKAVHRFFAVLPLESGERLAKITVKEFAEAPDGSRIYSVEAVELNEKTPAAIWVASTVRADGLDPTSIRSAGDVLSLADRVERSNHAGTQAPGDPGPRLSRATAAIDRLREQPLPMGYKVADLLNDSGKVSWWSKTVGTMHHLAQRNPAFKRVYDGAQRFLHDVSRYATEAADMAPTLLPKLEHLRDITKAPVSAEDTQAIAAPIFEGTLRWTRDARGEVVPADDVGTAGVRWTADELRERFGLTDAQVGLYREFRAAVDKSLTDLGVADLLAYAGADAKAVRDAALAAGDVSEAARIITDHLAEVAQGAGKDRAAALSETGAQVLDKAQRVADLLARGYAPLSRFGHYSVDVVDAQGERLYFGLFDSKAEASRMARRMREQHADATVTQGTMSDQAFQMFAGVSPETAELFGHMLGLSDEGGDASSQAFQQYIKLAKSNRSALKRLIERKGIEGFSEDAGRVLASFVLSNARATSKNLHLGEMSQAVQDIAEDKGQGELLDAAVKLHRYVTNPQEEAPAMRGLMFFQFLGGSVAAGLVNMTQPLMVTFPYLSQWGGVGKAALRMRQAVRDAAKDATGDEALDAAMKRAEEEGVVSPQEVHALMAQAKGAGGLRAGDGSLAGTLAAKGGNALSKMLLVWGRPFALAEQFNRRVTFIAAYRTAQAEGIANAYEFASKAIDETQYVYSKANRPAWARGAIGSVLFTFKIYSISTVELLTRLAKSGPEGKRAALLMLALIVLAAGVEGLPGAGDLDDVVDGALQRLGYNFSTKQARREFFAGVLGEDGARFVLRGVSGLPGVPIDVAGRLGLGNLIPGTGLLTRKTDHTSDVLEVAGPAGALAKQAGTALGAASTGDVGQALQAMLPVAAANVAKAMDMAAMGMYRDSRGRKVLDTDAMDAFVKAVGFQPADVARVQEAAGEQQRAVALVKLRETEIADQWARGVFERDREAVAQARRDLAAWNDDNPHARIVINDAQIVRRVRQMNMSRAERVAKTAPKEIRAQVQRELEGAR